MAFSPTTIATQTSVNTARDLYETKQRAAKYYDSNGVPKKMEEILNSMFYENPEDVYGHLANFFEQYARLPTISKINARIALDSKGHSTLQTEVYCTVKNKVKLCCTSVCCNPNSNLPENAKAEDTEPEEEAREIGVHEAQALVESEISKRLCGQDPSHQRSIDEIISNLYLELKTAEEERLAKEAEEKGGEETSRDDASSQASGKKGGKASAKGQKKKGKSATVVFAPAEPPEFFLPSCNAVNAVSMAVCSTAASLNNMPLFEHVASLKYNLIPQDLSVPLPMVTILQSGRSMPGKSNCIKEYMVVPKPGMPLSESVPHIQKIYAHVAKGFFAKGGVAARFVNDLGTLCPVLDRPEQGLDLLQEAITSCGLTPGEDFFLAINCAGHELFDYEKGKYEILVGQQKLAEDLVEFWAELIGRYPSIIAVIDPMRKQERDHWMRLSERISDQCFVIGNHAYHRPGLLKNEELTEHFQTSGIVLKLDRVTTISDAMETATKMEEAGNNITVETCYGESTDTILADFAVGIQAKFLKLGAPVRGERVALINRLLQIESQLEIHGRLVHQKAFTFPHLEPPPPPPEPEEGSVEEEPKKDNPAKKK